MNRKIAFACLLCVIILSSNAFSYTWPSSSTKITSAFGWRYIGYLEWHNGVDIHTGPDDKSTASEPIKAVTAGIISTIYSKPVKRGGNRILIGGISGWQYMHLSNSISGKWAFGQAYKQDSLGSYTIPVPYFAITGTDVNGKTSTTYYSKVSSIELNYKQLPTIPCQTSVKEGVDFAYSGNTGAKVIHLHLTKWLQLGSSEENPLKYLFGATGAPHDVNAPFLDSIGLNKKTGIVSGITDTGGERDFNSAEFYLNGEPVHDFSFDPCLNADGCRNHPKGYRYHDLQPYGKNTGFYPIADPYGKAQKYHIYYKWPDWCFRTSDVNIEVALTDIMSNEADYNMVSNGNVCDPPPISPPGNDHPDDTASVSSSTSSTNPDLSNIDGRTKKSLSPPRPERL